MSGNCEQCGEVICACAEGQSRLNDGLGLTVKLEAWISVKDRLPDSSTTVLCCCKWDFVGDEDPPFIEIRTFATKKFVDSKGKKVTHWMPLPDTPNV